MNEFQNERNKLKSKNADYHIVTKAGSREIAKRLNSEGGAILIVEPGRRSFPPDHVIDATLCLFQNCRLEDQSVQASWGADWVANRKKATSQKQALDRDYWLRRKDEPSGDKLWDHLVDTREGLSLTDSYRFEISPQSVVSRGYLDENSTAFYIPKPTGFRTCFTFAITEMVRTINGQAMKRKGQAPLTDAHVARIVDYIIADLRTGDIMRKNLEHGLMADAALGI